VYAGRPEGCQYTFDTNAAQTKLYKILSKTGRIPELDLPQTIPQYGEVPLSESIYPIIEANDVIIVAGAFFGDEGKGKTVDAIAKHPQCAIVARTNSGENAGHTVFDKEGRKYVFHLAPSGLLIEGKKNMVGPEAVMDPISFMEVEIAQLIKNKIAYQDRLWIGNVHIVAPYHKLLDMILSAVNSSTMKGMSPVHASKVTKRGIRLDHIFNDEATMRRRLAKDMELYDATLLNKKMSNADVLALCQANNADGVKRVPDHVIAFVEAENKLDFLVKLYYSKVRDNKQFPQRADVTHEIRVTLDAGKKVLLEGPQSYWLSNSKEKFWESSTSADTSASGMLATAQFNFQKYKSVVINVHKSPGASRVGVGANPAAYIPQDFFSAQNIATLRDMPAGACADFEAIQKLYGESIRDNGMVEPSNYTDATGTYNVGVAMSIASAVHHGEEGATTEKPRICGLFDCVAHFEVNAVQGPLLTVSAVDRGDDYDVIGVTIAYVYHHPEGRKVSSNGVEYSNGKIIKAGDTYPSEAALSHCYPIVKAINGWRQTPIAFKKRAINDPLPPGVCEFIATVEYFTKAKVLSIGNGPIGNNIIYLKQ
jgi:adenylosuccinate synthase